MREGRYGLDQLAGTLRRVDPLWVMYGAIAGVVAGTLWGRFVRPQQGAWPRTLPSALGALAVYLVLEIVRQQVLLQVPGQFWVVLVFVGWFAIQLGQRMRRA